MSSDQGEPNNMPGAQAPAGNSHAPAGPSNGQPGGGAAADAPGQNNVLIQMARSELRGVDESQFKPLRVPIGPCHRTSFPVAEIEGKKRGKFDEFFREGYQRRNQAWNDVKKLVESRRGREWYPADLVSSMPNADLIKMLLHDGYYVLSSLIDYTEGAGGVVVAARPRSALPPPTHGGSSSEEENTVLRDILFLLENQVPWLVLKVIHGCIMGGGTDDLLLDVERVRELLKEGLFFISGSRTSMPPDPRHLLHLVHHYLKPTTDAASTVVAVGNDEHERRRRRRMGRWRRATEYCRYANVKLKPQAFKDRVVESILDVRLKGRTLRIPTLRIDGHTWTVMRNLMALEEQMQMPRRPVTAYCVFMSQLACKVEDVELLQRQDILQHFLANDEEVVQGFGNLCRKVVFDIDDPHMNYLNGTWHRLQKKCRKTRNKFAGSFVQMHCGNLVQFLAFLGALMLFLFQAAQVVIAYLSLRKQKS